MVKYTYAIGDVHGCLKELNQMLNLLDQFQAARLDDQHQIIFVGDYVDRGPDNPGTVSRLIQLEKERPNSIFLRGNHDDMFIKGEGLHHYNTWDQYVHDELHRYEEHKAWLEQRPFYHEDEKNYYIHGGLSIGLHPSECTEDMLMWLRNTEHNQHKKKLVVGHTPHMQNRPRIYDGGINVDGGAVFGGFLLCAILEDGIYNERHLSVNTPDYSEQW